METEVGSETTLQFWSRYRHEPLMVSSRHLDLFMTGVRQVLTNPMHAQAVAEMSSEDSAARLGDDDFWSGWRAYYRPYRVKDGILTIPVQGSLVNRSGFQFGRWMTGYEYIRQATIRGMGDKAVKGIVFDIDSPGGDAAGNFELAEEIAGYRKTKPMLAMANGLALSGGYSLATAAHETVVSRSGMTGSVGVVTTHVDASKMFDEFGLNISLIFAGKHKVDGHPFGPLPDSVREDIQARIDKTYGRFTKVVAANRRMSDDDVRETEARVYDAEESVSVGFADRIGEYRDAVAQLALRSDTMSKETGGQAASAETQTAADQAPNGEQAAAVDSAKATARQEERTRFATVQGSDEYKGREKLANHLLGSTDMTADAIVETLKASPAEQPDAASTQRNHFQERMDREPSPQVGGIEQGQEVERAEDGRPMATVTILDTHRKVTGHVPMSERSQGGNA